MKNPIQVVETRAGELVSDQSAAFVELMRHLSGIDYDHSVVAAEIGRAFPRLAINQAIHCQDLNQYRQLPGQLMDISPKGLQIVTSQDLLNEALVLVNNNLLRAVARVCHVELTGQQVRLGCEFVKVRWLAKNLLVDSYDDSA